MGTASTGFQGSSADAEGQSAQVIRRVPQGKRFVAEIRAKQSRWTKCPFRRKWPGRAGQKGRPRGDFTDRSRIPLSRFSRKLHLGPSRRRPRDPGTETLSVHADRCRCQTAAGGDPLGEVCLEGDVDPAGRRRRALARAACHNGIAHNLPAAMDSIGGIVGDLEGMTSNTDYSVGQQLVSVRHLPIYFDAQGTKEWFKSRISF